MRAAELARRIKKTDAWKRGIRKIKLNSCNSAKGNDPIAQQLSRILQATVIGADQPVWSFLGTWGTYGADAEGRKYDKDGQPKHEGVPDFTNPGHWITFVNGARQDE